MTSNSPVYGLLVFQIHNEVRIYAVRAWATAETVSGRVFSN